MKNLETLAQQVWSETTLDGKKGQLFNMIEQFKHPKKAEMFMQQVQLIQMENCFKILTTKDLLDF